jgi:acyl carrier protein
LQKLLRDEVMDRVDKDYELTMLKTAIDMYLDKTIAFTEEGLRLLESNRDRFVWELTTNIYSQSGHKVEFYIARNGVNSWFASKKTQLLEFRRAEEEKARQIIAEEIRLVAAEKRRIVEQNARLAAEREALIFSRTLLIEEIDKFAEQIAEAKRNGNESNYIVEHLGTSKAGIFFRLRGVIIEQLSVELDTVNLDSDLRNDLNADSLDAVELIMAIEEEFDIEISDEVAEEITSVGQSVNYIHYKMST